MSDSALRVTSSLWIYNDGLVGGWVDWTGTWSPDDIANSSPVFSGSRSISVTFAPGSGFFLHNSSAVSTAGFGYLDFEANGGATAGANIVAFTTFSGVSGPHISVGSYCAAGKIPANTWTRCRVPLSVLQADNASIDGVTLRFEGTDSMPPVYFDSIRLTASSSTTTTSPSQTVAVSITPAAVALSAGQTQSFSTTVSGTTNTTVTWTVLEGSAGGGVSSAGTYTAPSASGTYHVVATSAADASKSATATVTVTAPTPTPTPVPTPTPTPTPGSTQPNCATAPLRTNSSTADHGYGAVHYFCSSGGSDSNDGLSPSTPKASWSAAVSTFNSMNGGDTVALCRGGTWTASGNSIYNARCNASNTCDFRDYGSGNRPVINWSAGSTADRLFNVATAGHDEGYRWWNLDIRNANANGVNWYVYNDVTDMDFCNLSVDGGYLHLQIDGGDAGQGRNNRITIRNSSFSNGTLDSIIGASSNLTIDSNVFTNNGTSSTCPQGYQFCHTVYISDENIGSRSDASSMETQNVRITNNSMTLDASHDCGSVIVHIAGRHNGLIAENNYISAALNTTQNSSCTALSVNESGYGNASWFRNTAFRRNRIVLPNAGPIGQEAISMSGTGTTASCSSPPGVQCPGQSLYKNGDPVPPSVIADNVITQYGASAPAISIQPKNSDGGANNGDSTSGVIVYNNSIYMPTSTWQGIIIGGEGSNYVVQNNAVYVGGSGSVCMQSSQGMLRNSNNYCRTSSLGAVAGTLNSSIGAGSMWTGASAGNFTPATGGVLVGSGNATYYDGSAISASQVTWGATDLAVARSSPSDIGAVVH